VLNGVVILLCCETQFFDARSSTKLMQTCHTVQIFSRYLGLLEQIPRHVHDDSHGKYLVMSCNIIQCRRNTRMHTHSHTQMMSQVSPNCPLSRALPNAPRAAARKAHPAAGPGEGEREGHTYTLHHLYSPRAHIHTHTHTHSLRCKCA
jgi:hypothetical protein